MGKEDNNLIIKSYKIWIKWSSSLRQSWKFHTIHWDTLVSSQSIRQLASRKNNALSIYRHIYEHKLLAYNHKILQRYYDDNETSNNSFFDFSCDIDLIKAHKTKSKNQNSQYRLSNELWNDWLLKSDSNGVSWLS